MASPIAWAYSHAGFRGWSLASHEPTVQNTYLIEQGFDPASLHIEPLGFVPASDNVLCCWAWRKAPDHRGTRGAFLHRHKGRGARRHAFPTRVIRNMRGWAIGKRKPSGRAAVGLVIRELYFTSELDP